MQLIVAIVIAVISMSIAWEVGSVTSFWITLSLSCIGVSAIGLNYERKLEKSKIELQKKYINKTAEEYRNALAKKRMQLVTVDDYGDIDDTKWMKEITRFFNKKIMPMPQNRY